MVAIRLSSLEEQVGKNSRSAVIPCLELTKSGLVWVCGLTLMVGALLYDRTLQDLYTLPKRAMLGVLGPLFAGAACALLARSSTAVSFPRGGALGMAILLWGIVSASRSTAPTESIDLLRDFFSLCAWSFFAFLLVTDGRRLRILQGAMVLAGFAIAGLGMLQWLGVSEWPWPRAADGKPRFFEALPVVDAPGSVFGHVNMASEVVVVSAVLALGAMIAPSSSGQRRSAVFSRIALLVMVMTQGAFLAVGMSRAAWIGMLSGAVVLGVVALRRSSDVFVRAKVAKRLAFAGLLLVVGFLALDPLVVSPGRGGGPPTRMSTRLRELFTLSDGTEWERLVLWKNTVAMAESSPVLGVGPGNWKIDYARFARSRDVLTADRFSLARQPEAAHMDPLQALAELGAPGLLLFAALFGFTLVAAFRGGPHALTRARCGAGIITLLTVSCFAYPFQGPVSATFAFVLIGGIEGAGREERRAARFGVGPLGLRVLAWAFFLVSVVIGLSMHARIVGNREYWSAKHNLLAARTQVEDRGAVGLTSAELQRSGRDGLDRAAAREPANIKYLNERAFAAWEEGRGDEAGQFFDRALALHPGFLNALLLRSQLLLQTRTLNGGRPFAEAEALLQRALRIQPDAPELRLALGQVYDLLSEEVDDPQGLARHEAVHQYRVAGRLREYMPEARLRLVRRLLEDGGDVAEITRELSLAEVNASLEPSLLAQCARLYSHPTLASISPDLFGPLGRKTLSVWQRVLDLSGHRNGEALLEVRCAELQRVVSTEGRLPAGDLEKLLELVEAELRVSPRNLRARYFRALIHEQLGNDQLALADLATLARVGQVTGRQDPRLIGIADAAVETAIRIQSRSKIEATTPENGK